MTTARIGLDQLAQAYDAAMRLWAEACLPEVAVWLDPSLRDLPAGAFTKQPSTFVAPVVSADLLLSAGPGRLLHVEYETNPGRDLVRRMLEYRVRMMREYPGHRLSQYVLVLDSGVVRGFDDQKEFGFTLDVQVLYLREHDPAEFLAAPVLAPFVALGRGSRQDRERALGNAIRLINGSGRPDRPILLQATEALARIHLDRENITRIQKENGMNIQPLVELFQDTDWGAHLQDVARKEGREQEREEMLLAVLLSRFEDRPGLRAVAHRLAGWENKQAAIVAITRAPDPEHLLTVEPPQPPTARTSEPGPDE